MASTLVVFVVVVVVGVCPTLKTATENIMSVVPNTPISRLLISFSLLKPWFVLPGNHEGCTYMIETSNRRAGLSCRLTLAIRNACHKIACGWRRKAVQNY